METVGAAHRIERQHVSRQKTEAMKLNAELNGVACEVMLAINDSRIVAEVGGRKYKIEAHQSPDGSYLFFENGRVFELRVSPRAGSKQTFEVAIRGTNHLVTVIDPRRLATGQDSDRHQHGAAEIIAPMPGKVVRVLLELGQQVEAGTGVIIVEAMKMQNEMKSPRAGTVASIKVKAGDTVEAGALLAVVE